MLNIKKKESLMLNRKERERESLMLNRKEREREPHVE